MSFLRYLVAFENRSVSLARANESFAGAREAMTRPGT